MLPLDASYWIDAIAKAETDAARHHEPLRRLTQRFRGNWYDTSRTADATPENHVFAWASWMHAQLTQARPNARVKARWQTVHGDIARWMEAGIDAWIAKSKLLLHLSLAIRDALLGFGVVKIGMEPATDSGGEGKNKALWNPFVQHVTPWDFGMDPRAEHWGECRFLYQKYWRDLDDITSGGGVDPAVAQTLASTYEAASRRGEAPTEERRRVQLIDLWLPEHGKIGTLATSSIDSPSGQWLRPPAPWYGPACGPFIVLGFHSVSGSPYPMSRIQPIMEQFEALQRHLVAETAEAETLKTFVGVEQGNDEAKSAVINAKNGEVRTIPGLSRGVIQQIDVGSRHPQRLDHIERMRDRMSQMLAFTESQRGIANAKTATANSIAQANADVTTEWHRGKVNEFVATVLTGVGWWMFNSPAYEQRVSITGATPDRTMDGTLAGGTQPRYIDGVWWPGMSEVDWERDFIVDVDPNSMQHISDERRQQDALAIFSLQQAAYQAMATMPGANVRWAVDLVGETMNHQDLFDTLFAEGVEQQMLQAPAMFQRGVPLLGNSTNPALVHAMTPRPRPQAQALVAPGLGQPQPTQAQPAQNGFTRP